MNLREAAYQPDPLSASSMGNYSTLRFHIASDDLARDQEQPSGSEDEDERSDERQNKRYHPVATDDIECSGDTVESQDSAARTSRDALVGAEGVSGSQCPEPSDELTETLTAVARLHYTSNPKITLCSLHITRYTPTRTRPRVTE